MLEADSEAAARERARAGDWNDSDVVERELVDSSVEEAALS
ncbi:MAG: hypothetical protein QM756_16395 [Polyangiaceae bacterium]